MTRVRDAVDADREVAVGGVEWKPAPLKGTPRIVEKLCLDPTQRAALDAGDPQALDASLVLDVVRGMFVCSSMEHAHAALRALAAAVTRGEIGPARSKNRFADPSGGGW